MGQQARGKAAKIAGTIAGVAGTTLLVAACGSSSSSKSAAATPKSSVAAASHSAGSSTGTTGPKAASGTVDLKVRHTVLGNVLTGPEGYTLYGFTRDSPTTSACTGTCAKTWQPLTGTPRLPPGVTGTVGTITRSGGVKQATFDGHPLYTFTGDKSPGQTKGNGEFEFGGKWLAVPVAVTPAAPVAPPGSVAPSVAPPSSAAPSNPTNASKTPPAPSSSRGRTSGRTSGGAGP